MKKYFTIFSLILFLVSCISACSQNGGDSKPIADNSGQNTEQTEESRTEKDKEDYPVEISNWLKNMQPYFVAGKVDLGEKTFLIVNWGEKRTAGYSVSIADIEENENEIIVGVKFTSPAGPVSQVISYPYTVSIIDRSNKNNTVHFQDIDGQEYIPQIVGNQPTELFEKSSNDIKIMNAQLDQDKVTVSGIARIFEATVNYSFNNSNGEIIREDYLTASSGAPDWGYFLIDNQDIPDNTVKLEIYSRSAKDGSQQDLISIDLP